MLNLNGHKYQPKGRRSRRRTCPDKQQHNISDSGNHKTRLEPTGLQQAEDGRVSTTIGGWRRVPTAPTASPYFLRSTQIPTCAEISSEGAGMMPATSSTKATASEEDRSYDCLTRPNGKRMVQADHLGEQVKSRERRFRTKSSHHHRE